MFVLCDRYGIEPNFSVFASCWNLPERLRNFSCLDPAPQGFGCGQCGWVSRARTPLVNGAVTAGTNAVNSSFLLIAVGLREHLEGPSAAV